MQAGGQMRTFKSYWFYAPIVLSVGAGFIIGGYLTFGIKYLNCLPCITDQSARLILMIYGMGLLGISTYCSKFWAVDVHEVVYEGREEFLPHFFDFFGYVTTIIGGGVTGVIFYLLLRTGLSIASSASTTHDINLPAALIIGYCGGLIHFRMQEHLSNIAVQILKKKRVDDASEDNQN
jgi:hypothetical protein